MLDLTLIDGHSGRRYFGEVSRYADSFVGGSISGSGDFNGDGLTDVVIGAPNHDADSSFCSPRLASGRGAAYVILGQEHDVCIPSLDHPLADSPPGVTVIKGVSAYDKCGYSVAFVGDINGDGLDDIAVGQPEVYYGTDGRYITEAGTGRVFVIFGQTAGLPSEFDPDELDGTNGFRVEGATDADFTGWSVSSAGDINGDGIDDLAIGATEPGAAPGSGRPLPAGEGSVYVIFGRDHAAGDTFPESIALAHFDATLGFRVHGEDVDDRFGSSMAVAGDVNGDGFSDLVLGASFAQYFKGQAYILFGRDEVAQGEFPAVIDAATLEGDLGVRIQASDANWGGIGASVASAGDMNGDGLDDIAIGAPRARRDGAGVVGHGAVIFGWRPGSPGAFQDQVDLDDLDGSNGFVFEGSRYGSVGEAVAGLDLNGDGIDDVVLGNDMVIEPSSGASRRAVVVVYGRDWQQGPFEPSMRYTDIDSSTGFLIVAEEHRRISLASAGDLDGDGIHDLAIGLPRDTVYEEYGCPGISGIAYVVFGRSPRCCADIDFDGQLTIFDFLAFQSLFGSGHPIADFDFDCEFTIFDFLAYQTVFEDGCP